MNEWINTVHCYNQETCSENMNFSVSQIIKYVWIWVGRSEEEETAIFHTIPHQPQVSHHEGIHGIETNLCPFIILELRKSTSHALTAGKTITSILWWISEPVGEVASPKTCENCVVHNLLAQYHKLKPTHNHLFFCFNVNSGIPLEKANECTFNTIPCWPDDGRVTAETCSRM